MLVSSSAPLPNNSLTPLPQAWADARNARMGMLTLLANRAKSITDCYAPASSFVADAGPIFAAQVAQTQANIPNATIASGAMDGTPNAPSSGDTSSRVPAPVVLPLNAVALGTVGGSMMPAESSCHPGRRAVIPQPRMMMPQPAPAVIAPQPAAPAPPDTQSSYPPSPAQVMAAPAWKNLCWAMRNGAVLQSQFTAADYMNLDFTCSQKGYAGACPPPGAVEGYLLQPNLPMIPVSQTILDAIPQAPDLTGVGCPQSYVMGGLAGIAPRWGSYSRRAQDSGGSIDWLATICSHPLAAILISAAVGWGLTQITKKGRG
jgi:hypothetical protein